MIKIDLVLFILYGLFCVGIGYFWHFKAVGGF